MTYSDLLGCYSIKLARRNQYILICYYYDINAILAEVLPSRSGACINKGVQKLLDTLTTSEHNPNLHIIDNEACGILKKTLLKRNISYHLVPLHIHIGNDSERAIHTSEDQFIAGLCSTDPKNSAQ